jgi:hypothetical protein
MDRAVFGDEPLIVFINIYCFSVFNFEFYFLQRYGRKDALRVQMGQPSCKDAFGCSKPSNKFVTGGKRVLATLWQICNRVSKVNGSPLTNSPEGIGNFCK